MQVIDPECKNVCRISKLMNSCLQNPAVESMKVVGTSPFTFHALNPIKFTIDKTET